MKQCRAMNGLVNFIALAESVALSPSGHGVLLASLNVFSIFKVNDFNLSIQIDTMTGVLEFALLNFEQMALFSYSKHFKITNLTSQSLHEVCLITSKLYQL